MKFVEIKQNVLNCGWCMGAGAVVGVGFAVGVGVLLT